MNATFTQSKRLVARTLALGLMVTLAFATAARADVVFSGAGKNLETGDAGQSASARFSLSTDTNKLETLTLTLTNTARATTTQGDALTGILFDFGGKKVSLSLSSVALASGSLLWTASSTKGYAADLTGAWTDKLASDDRPIEADYGLATTGFGGEFKGNLSLGTSSPDYGIVGVDTASAKMGGDKKSPFVNDAVTFKMKVTSGLLNESDLDHVSFLYGTTGTGVISAGNRGQVPEPATLALVGMALGASRLARRRASSV